MTPSTLRKFFGDHGSLGKFFNGDFGETDGDSGKDEEPPETYTPGEIQKIMSNDKDEEGRLISTCCLLLSTLVTRVSEEFRSKVNDIKFEKGEKMSIMVYITYIVVKGYPTSHIGELAVALYKKASVLKKGEVLSSSDFFLFRDAFNFLNKYGEEETVYDPMVDAPENVIPGGPMSLFG